jgi:hypothetical protein
VLPKGFALRTRLTGNVATWVGLIFFTFGSLMAIAIFFASPWATLFPLFFALGGFGMLRLGLTPANNTLRAFRFGTAVAGHVHSVDLDSSNRINLETEMERDEDGVVLGSTRLSGSQRLHR